MSLWGAVAGVAVLVGPIAGGLLVDGLGWQWIFFVNVPVGVVGFVLAVPAGARAVDDGRAGSTSSAWRSAPSGCSCCVFGIQEGADLRVGRRGRLVWALIIGGVVVLALFVGWQTRAHGAAASRWSCSATATSRSPTSPSPRSASAVTAQAFPITLYAQGVRGLSPTGAALLLAPSAVISTCLAPYVGRLTDRAHPRWIAAFGLVVLRGRPAVARRRHATRHPDLGAAAADRADGGRQRLHVGSDRHRGDPQPADGPGRCRARASTTPRARSARCWAAPGIAALMQARLVGRPARCASGSVEAGIAQLPPALHAAFSTAMAQSLLLPAGGAARRDRGRVGFALPRHLAARASPARRAPSAGPDRHARRLVACCPPFPNRSPCGSRPRSICIWPSDRCGRRLPRPRPRSSTPSACSTR